jgi:L-serine dehydratase
MGPRFAALAFRQRALSAVKVRITLYGSLAATGKGHLTDWAVAEPFQPTQTEIVWEPGSKLPRHPNGLKFEALDCAGQVTDSWIGYSVGGGALMDEQGVSTGGADVYPFASMQEILEKSDGDGRSIWEYVAMHEGPEVWEFLGNIWSAMQAAIERGLNAEGVLPGSLHIARKASSFHAKALNMAGYFNQTALLFSYALAVSEENSSGGEIVTAPTCGSCGVMPAVLYVLQKHFLLPDDKIIRALATGGLIGNLAKRNASISGAEVGCQGEVGVACAMAAGSAAQLLGGTIRQIEYAAEMGLEHHLGLTCDPIGGYVQIPCIERNAIAAVRAVDCAAYALLSDGRHIVSFDEVVRTMLETGRDMKSGYRETALAGLAKIHIMKMTNGVRQDL